MVGISKQLILAAGLLIGFSTQAFALPFGLTAGLQGIDRPSSQQDGSLLLHKAGARKAAAKMRREKRQARRAQRLERREARQAFKADKREARQARKKAHLEKKKARIEARLNKL